MVQNQARLPHSNDDQNQQKERDKQTTRVNLNILRFIFFRLI